MTETTGSEFILVDSSGWLEALTEDTKASQFKPLLSREETLLVPSIVIYEVYKKLRSSFDKSIADSFFSHALRCQVVGMDEHIAIGAADASLTYKLPMADAIIYATAQSFHAQLITADAHFQGIPGVTLI